MKKTVLISALLGLSALSFATNGDNLIGVSPASRGMGGIGVGMPVGATDSVFRNPAWMSYYKGFNMSFGGIVFLPEVKARQRVFVDTDDANSNPNTVVLFDSNKQTSQSKLFVVPEVGIVHSISDKLSLGLGAFGVSGMGVDYRNKLTNNQPSLNNMHTNFQFMRVIPTLSYKVNEAISVAGAVHLAYGSLDMGAIMCINQDNDGVPGHPNCWNAGGGQSQTYGIGFQVGVAYNMGDFVYAGATYQSPVAMTYKRVFDSNGNNIFEDLKLTQPQELAFGVGVKPVKNFKLGVDLRWINWSGAKGYKEFQWDDQWVFALGGELKPVDKLALRAGYNYGKSPIKGGAKSVSNQNRIPDLSARFRDFNIAWFNLIGFPAITEQHVTLGLGYEFTKNFGVDFAYKRAFNKKVRATDNAGMGMFVEAENAQSAYSIGLNWKF
ncbi:MAG: outer membrane protein transport protein [Aquificaceae bacterium]|nr:outer membrane protein transport protein [Aquificaceae bacterium]